METYTEEIGKTEKTREKTVEEIWSCLKRGALENVEMVLGHKNTQKHKR